MARFDKYEPKAGGFRAPLAADFAAADVNTAFAVGLDVNGRAVLGGGNTGVVGVLVLTQAKNAGDVIDVMTAGDIVEFGGVAGTAYYADATTGAISTNPDAGGAAGSGAGVPVGHTVEANRLVVRV